MDVILGYSQGAAATTRVLNEVYSGQWPDNCLKGVEAAIFLGCPRHPEPSKEVGAAVEALFCNGDKDPLTSLKGAKEHAAKFENSHFFEYKGGHDVRKNQQAPIRNFLLSRARSDEATGATKRRKDEAAGKSAAEAKKEAQKDLADPPIPVIFTLGHRGQCPKTRDDAPAPRRSQRVVSQARHGVRVRRGGP